MADQRDAERLGDAFGGDVVMGRADAAGGEHVVPACPERVQRGDDLGLDVGDDPRLDQPDADLVERRAEESQVRVRSEEHTSELQSLMRISYAVFCLKKKIKHKHIQ